MVRSFPGDCIHAAMHQFQHITMCQSGLALVWQGLIKAHEDAALVVCSLFCLQLASKFPAKLVAQTNLTALLAVWTPTALIILCRGQGTEMQDCIVDMKRHLKLPNGIELVDANKGPSQLGTHGVHYRMHRMDFSIKVHSLFAQNYKHVNRLAYYHNTRSIACSVHKLDPMLRAWQHVHASLFLMA